MEKSRGDKSSNMIEVESKAWRTMSLQALKRIDNSITQKEEIQKI